MIERKLNRIHVVENVWQIKNVVEQDLDVSIDFKDSEFIVYNQSNYSYYSVQKGLDDGMYNAYYEYDFFRPAIQAIIRNGQLSDYFKFWDEDGQLKYVGTYKKGLKHGIAKYYFYTDSIVEEYSVLWENDTVQHVSFLEDSSKVYIEVKVKYGDVKYMESDKIKKEKYVLKKGLPDARYIVFYDEKLTKDTAIVQTYINGYPNYISKEWPRNGSFCVIQELRNGNRHGFRKEVWTINEENKLYTNLSLWFNNTLQRDLQTTW